MLQKQYKEFLFFLPPDSPNLSISCDHVTVMNITAVTLPWLYYVVCRPRSCFSAGPPVSFLWSRVHCRITYYLSYLFHLKSLVVR